MTIRATKSESPTGKVVEIDQSEAANAATIEPTKSAEEILSESEALRARIEKYGSQKILKTLEKANQESALKPYQAELILLQKYLEATKRRMIILFEGRDASGKGGTIRRATRYMNEKHYRVVALGKPTDAGRTQWYGSSSAMLNIFRAVVKS